MKTKLVSLLSFLAILVLTGANRYEEEALSVCVSSEEMKLYELIMDYRKSKGLPRIELSKSLTFVAQTHVKDLENNNPTNGRCNMHSWSNKGKWSSCCYTSDHAKASCMWDKPKELTDYQGTGFEIAFGGYGSYSAAAKGALDAWKKSGGHNAVIVNSGIWKRYNWQAIGIGIYGSYAVVWFGSPVDAAGKPTLCGDTSDDKNAISSDELDNSEENVPDFIENDDKGDKVDSEEICVSAEERKLYNLINEYRQSKGLHKVPLSKSLTKVAQVHVKDLQNNAPNGGRCNTHSWSAKGEWSACCYTPDHKQAKCMWNKPKELTSYTANGFEIAYWSSGSATAVGALNSWKRSGGHNAVIVNSGIWKSWPWGAMGVAVYGNYSVVWFGKPADAAGSPINCSK